MRKSFWFGALFVFAAITILTYFPAFIGRVPFPRDMILQFAAWQDPARSEPLQHYADIGDLVTAFYPSRVLIDRAVRDGALPLWNPHFLGGAPFLASPQSSMFYPPNALYYVLSVPTAWTLCFMIRMFISGVFMTAFVRSIGGTKAGSIFGGVVFALCGFMTAWQGQPMDDAAAWLPLVCYAVIRLHDQPSRRSVALAAFAFAMPVLAGHPETAAHVTMVGIAIAVYVWLTSRLNLHFLLRFMAAGVLAVALTAVQIIPTLEWLAQMPSPLDIRWPVLAAHDALAWVSRDIARAPNSAGLWNPESTAYVGMLTLLVAPLGLMHRNRRYAILLAAITAGALAVAYGLEPVHWIVNRTPVLAGLKNGRMIFIAGFGVAGLAGLGISALEEETLFKPGRGALALGVVALAFVAVFVLVRHLQLATTFRVEFTRRPSFSRALLLLSLVPIVWKAYGGLRGRIFPAAACALIAFDLITLGYGYTGFSRRNEIFPRSPLFDFLTKQTASKQFRTATLGIPFPLNTNIVYGFDSVDGYEVRMLPAQLAFCLDYVDNTFPGLSFVTSRVLSLNDRRLDLLNVQYFVTAVRSPEFADFMASGRYPLAYNDGNVALFENKSVLPRAFAVPSTGIRVFSGTDTQLASLKDSQFDPLQTVLLSSLPASLQGAGASTPLPGVVFSSSVKIAHNGINRVSLRTMTSSPSVLVVSQTYYPGWRAFVDGNSAEIFAADLALTGIALPAGVHEVELAFRPSSVTIGAVITVAAAVILLVLMIAHAKSSGPKSIETKQILKMTSDEPSSGIFQ